MLKTSADGRVSIPVRDGFSIVEETADKPVPTTLLKAKRTGPNEFFFLLAKRYEVAPAQALAANELADVIYRRSYEKIFERVMVAGSRWVELGGVRFYETAYEFSHGKMGHIVKLERVATLGPVVFVLSGEGRTDDMRACFEAVEELFERARFAELSPGAVGAAKALPSDVETLYLQGAKLHDAGRYAEALAITGAALARSQRELGATHRLTFVGLANVGETHRAMGDLAAAEPILADAVSLGTSVAEPGDPHLTRAIVSLGRTQLDRGRLDAAEELFRDALKRAEGFAPRSPYVAMALDALGQVRLARGDFAGAEPLLRDALALLPAEPGSPTHPERFRVLHDLGRAVGRSGRVAEAEPLLVESLEGRRHAFGLEHPETVESLASLATLHSVARAPERAEPLGRQALELTRKVLGPTHPSVSDRLIDRTLVLNALGRAPEAEPLLVEALAIRTERLGADHPATRWVAENLAGLRAALSR